MYKVELTPDAFKELSQLDPVIAQRICKKIGWLSKNFEFVVPEPLKGNLEGAYKLRVGAWRVIYDVDTKCKLIRIHLIGHRKDIYK
ncbi:MAG TPA: type II toxin-antitoxin system RelE family toxin [Candidatus Hypogeohydataceae bacterium YC40]